MTVCSSAIPNWVIILEIFVLVFGIIIIVKRKWHSWKKVIAIILLILIAIAGFAATSIVFNSCAGLTKEKLVKNFNTEVYSKEQAEQLLRVYIIEEMRLRKKQEIATQLENQSLQLDIITNEETYSTFFYPYFYTINKNGKVMRSWVGD